MTYPMRRLWWRLRGGPVGHRVHHVTHLTVAGASLGFWMARCECSFTERAQSQAAAEGALRGHLAEARPWSLAPENPTPMPERRHSMDAILGGKDDDDR